MTEIFKNQDQSCLKSTLDTMPLYQGSENALMGLELEMFFLDRHQGYSVINPNQSQSIIDSASMGKDMIITREPCGIIEYVSSPYARNHNGVHDLLKKTIFDVDHIENHAEEIGISRLPISCHPTLDKETALTKVIKRPRVQDMIAAVDRKMPSEALEIGLLTSSTQLSLSYQTQEQGFADFIKANYLSPLFIQVFSNNVGIDHEGNIQKSKHKRRMDLYQKGYGYACGINPALCSETSAEGFYKHHLNRLYNQPMLYYFDDNNQTIVPEKKIHLKDLREVNLLTYNNVTLAESFDYYDVKITSLRDKDGQVSGKRSELRVMDSGRLQPYALTMITNMVTDKTIEDDIKKLFLLSDLDISNAPKSISKLNTLREYSISDDSQNQTLVYGQAFVDQFSVMFNDYYRHSLLSDFAEEIVEVAKSPSARDAVKMECYQGLSAEYFLREITDNVTTILPRLRLRCL